MSVTEAQLLAAGFSRVNGTGERFQTWVGPDPRPNAPPLGSATLVWDSISLRKKIVSHGDVDTIVAILGTIAVLYEVIDLIPNSVIPIATKDAMKTSLLQVLDEN